MEVVEPVEPQPTLPTWTPDNTLRTLVRYIYALDLPLRQQSMALAIANRVFWEDCPKGKAGEGCFAGLATLAHDAKLGLRVASKTLAALVARGIIGRKRTLSGNSVTRIFEKVALHTTTQETDTSAPIPAAVCGNVPAPVGATNQPNETNPTAERENIKKLSLSVPRTPGRARETRQSQPKPSTTRHVKERETPPDSACPPITIAERVRNEALRQEANEALRSGRRGQSRIEGMGIGQLGCVGGDREPQS